MKYVYYERATGEIKIITPAKEEKSEHPYIEVEDADVDHIHSGRETAAMYFVKPISRTYPVGRIIKKDQASLNWTSINDWLYLVPTEEPPVTEFKITQDIKRKTITISLGKQARILWASRDFFKKSHFPIAACFGPDPHNLSWVKVFESKQLLEDIKFKYTGSDDIRIFTHRFFDCYQHEQLT